MKGFAILACLASIAQFQIASSIICYTCVYQEEDPGSEYCEENPRVVDLREYQDTKGETGDVSTNSLKYNCVTIKGNNGNSTNLGKKYIKRYATQIESYMESPYCDAKVPPGNDGLNLVTVSTCYCNKNMCNTDAGDTGTTDGPGGSGAYAIHASIFLLVPGLSTCIHKHLQ